MKLLAIALAAGSLWAQNTIDAQIDAERIIYQAETSKFEIAQLVNGPVVKNAPYSADAVTETVLVLGDGNRIESKSTTKIYRDSEGRERREENGRILINDPVAHRNLMVNAGDKSAENRTSFVLHTSGKKDFFVHTAPEDVGGKMIMLGKVAAKAKEGAEVDLGTRTIEGVPATGTKTTFTIPAGEIGNVRPIEIVDERWTSPELGVIVYSRHSDPREGVTEYRVINISRGEQPRTLFDVPADVAVPEGMKKGVIRMNVK